jgi:hypothetical protein
MSTTNDNYDQLQSAGLIHSDPLPDELRRVVDELDREEVAVIVDVARRLEAAVQSVEPPAGAASELKFVNWMVF